MVYHKTTYLMKCFIIYFVCIIVGLVIVHIQGKSFFKILFTMFFRLSVYEFMDNKINNKIFWYVDPITL